MLPHQRLGVGAYDRLAYRREDTTWVEQQWADDTSRVLVIRDGQLRPVEDHVVWLRPEDAPEGTRVLLGERRGVTHFAVLADAVDEADDEGWVHVRSLLSVLADDEDATLVLHAIGMAEWHRATRFCVRCGNPLSPGDEGHVLVCGEGHTTFPRTDPAVIMLISHGEPGSAEERCLLGHNAAWPEGRFSTLAGFCEPGETLEAAVRREVAEEVGVIVGEVAYVGNQPWPLPASLMLGFEGRALTTGVVTDDTEITQARWFTRAELHADAASGAVLLPSGFSISRSLIERWYGGELPGSW